MARLNLGPVRAPDGLRARTQGKHDVGARVVLRDVGLGTGCRRARSAPLCVCDAIAQAA
jgi:hypothetical protein